MLHVPPGQVHAAGTQEGEQSGRIDFLSHHSLVDYAHNEKNLGFSDLSRTTIKQQGNGAGHTKGQESEDTPEI